MFSHNVVFIKSSIKHNTNDDAELEETCIFVLKMHLCFLNLK